MEQQCTADLIRLTLSSPYGFSMLILTILVFLFTLILNIILIKQFPKSTKKVSSQYKCLVLSATTTGTLATLTKIIFMTLTIWDINTIVSVETMEEDQKQYELFVQMCGFSTSSLKTFLIILTCISTLVSMAAYLLVFITYWRRSILLFRNSMLSISGSKHVILTFLAIILILLFILQLIASLLWVDTLLSGTFAALFCLFYIVAIVFLSYLVFRGMKILLKTQQNMQGVKTRVVQGQIKITTKITILVIVSTSTTVITILSLIGAGTIPNGWPYALFQQSFDTLINNMCLYMQFEFAVSLYGKCCNWLHIYFENKYVVTNSKNNNAYVKKRNANKPEIGNNNNKRPLAVDIEIPTKSASPSMTSTDSHSIKTTTETDV